MKQKNGICCKWIFHRFYFFLQILCSFSDITFKISAILKKILFNYTSITQFLINLQTYVIYWLLYLDCEHWQKHISY